jgi:hypothetical protein
MDDPAAHPQPVAPTTATPASPVTVAVAPPSRRDRMRGPLLTAGIVGGLTLALHVRDPHTSGSWGLCPWFALTGHYCPGCGALRAVNDLGNGDILGAASSNLLFVAMVPLLVYWWLRWAQRAWSGAPKPASSGQHSGVWIAVATVVVIVFGVLRNLSAGSWLAP